MRNSLFVKLSGIFLHLIFISSFMPKTFSFITLSRFAKLQINNNKHMIPPSISPSTSPTSSSSFAATLSAIHELIATQSINKNQHPFQAIHDALNQIPDIYEILYHPLTSASLIKALCHMNTVNLSHLDIDTAYVESVSMGQCMSVFGSKQFDIAAFILPKGFKLYLHDHPNMIVCSKLLHGSVSIRSFSKDSESADPTVFDQQTNNQLERMNSKSPSSASSLSGSSSSISSEHSPHPDDALATLELNMTKSATDEPWILTPNEGNFHEITPLSHCVMLDILLPPYDDCERPCNFYTARKIENSELWKLKVLPLEIQHRIRLPEPVAYNGYHPI
jgi:hypothetical protein